MRYARFRILVAIIFQFDGFYWCEALPCALQSFSMRVPSASRNSSGVVVSMGFSARRHGRPRSDLLFLVSFFCFFLARARSRTYTAGDKISKSVSK